MRIINRTSYDTKDLQAIVTRVAAMEELTPAQKKHLRVEIVPNRNVQNSSSGFAYLNGTLARVRVWDKSPLSPKGRIDFAVVIAHELAHIRGVSGEYHMRRSVRHGRPRDEAGMKPGDWLNSNCTVGS